MTQLTTVKLYNVPFTRSGTNKCCFSSISDFESHLTCVASYSNATFVRDGVIDVPVGKANIDASANYISYINKKDDGTNGHRFFGFIESIDYLSPKTSRIYYSVDGFHSFINNATFPRTMVERTNAAGGDYDGIYNVPSDFTPTVKRVLSQRQYVFSQWYYLFYMPVSGRFPTPSSTQNSKIYGTVFTVIARDRNELMAVNKYLNLTGLFTNPAETVVNAVAIPKIIFDNVADPIAPKISNHQVTEEITLKIIDVNDDDPIELEQSITAMLPIIDDRFFNPPATSIRVRCGESSIEYPLSILDTTATAAGRIKIYAGFTPSPYIAVTLPMKNLSYGKPAITVSNFPTLPITVTNWSSFLQSALVSSITAGVSVGVSVASENYVGAIATIATHEITEKSNLMKTVLTPAHISGNAVPLYQAGIGGIFIEIMGPDVPEQTQTLYLWDNFGYPVKKVLPISPIPSGMSSCFWKTADIQVNGPMPEYARDEIRNAFNNGIRLWKSFTNFGKME